jgi:hypothetical protein
MIVRDMSYQARRWRKRRVLYLHGPSTSASWVRRHAVQIDGRRNSLSALNALLGRHDYS